jgi:protein transport protein SEC13
MSSSATTLTQRRSNPAAGGNGFIDLLSVEANDMQHDAVLDYYGRRLATCSSDKTIKIFEVEGESHRLVETLKG